MGNRDAAEGDYPCLDGYRRRLSCGSSNTGGPKLAFAGIEGFIQVSKGGETRRLTVETYRI